MGVKYQKGGMLTFSVTSPSIFLSQQRRGGSMLRSIQLVIFYNVLCKLFIPRQIGYFINVLAKYRLLWSIMLQVLQFPQLKSSGDWNFRTAINQFTCKSTL